MKWWKVLLGLLVTSLLAFILVKSVPLLIVLLFIVGLGIQADQMNSLHEAVERYCSRELEDPPGIYVDRSVGGVRGFSIQPQHGSGCAGLCKEALGSLKFDYVEVRFSGGWDLSRLMTENGVYRLEIVEAGDPNCENYEAYKKAYPENWKFYFQLPDENCVAVRKIGEFQSRFSVAKGEEATVLDLREGKLVKRTDYIIDRILGDVLSRRVDYAAIFKDGNGAGVPDECRADESKFDLVLRTMN